MQKIWKICKTYFVLFDVRQKIQYQIYEGSLNEKVLQLTEHHDIMWFHIS